MTVQSPTGSIPDVEFVTQLRLRTQRYLNAVDAWEEAYAKYYRLVTPGQISSDLEPFQHSFLQAREELKQLMPRARRMCLRHGFKDPFQLLVRVQLGAHAPQAGGGSAIGRTERNMVNRCIANLETAAMELTPNSQNSEAGDPTRRGRGLWRRIIEFFT